MMLKCKWLNVAMLATLLWNPMTGQADSSVERLERGVYYEETAGNIGSAIQEYSMIVREEQVNRQIVAEALYRLGKCYVKSGNAAGARQCFEQLTSRFSDQQKFADAAKRELATLPDGTTPSAEAKKQAEEISAKAWQLWQARDLKASEAEFRKALELDASVANSWNGLGWALSNQGHPTEAKEAFEKGIRLDSKHAGILNGLGWSMFSLNKVDEAISWWKKAIEAAPQATAAWSGLATAYIQRQEYEKAMEALRAWLRIEPQSMDAKAKLDTVEALLKRGGNNTSDGPPVTSSMLFLKLKNEITKVKEADAQGRLTSMYKSFDEIYRLTRQLEGQDTGRRATAEDWGLDPSRFAGAADSLAKLGQLAGIARAMSDEAMRTEQALMWQDVYHEYEKLKGIINGTAVAEKSAGSLVSLSQSSSETSSSGIDPSPSYPSPQHRLVADLKAPAKATAGPNAQAAGPNHELVAECDKRMKELQQRVATGTNLAWIDKNDLADLYEKWAVAHPDSAAKEAALVALKEYLVQNAKDPLFSWRLNHLLAKAALDLGRKDEATRYLDAALSAYPEANYMEPSKQSKYQHIINERAKLVLEKNGPDAAEQFLTEKLATDSKFDYLFLSFWESEYKKTGQEQRIPGMKEKVRVGYEKRKAAFPAKAGLVNSYVKMLVESR